MTGVEAVKVTEYSKLVANLYPVPHLYPKMLPLFRIKWHRHLMTIVFKAEKTRNKHTETESQKMSKPILALPYYPSPDMD